DVYKRQGVSCAEGFAAVGAPVPVMVGISGGVELSAGEVRLALPGEQVVYKHMVTNTANVTQTVALTLASSRGWATAVPTVTPPLAPHGGTALVTVTVDVPPDAVSGTVETAMLAATGNVIGQDVAEDRTVVGVLGGVELSAGQVRGALPGERVMYTHIVTNTTNVTQAVVLTLASSQGWATVVPMVTPALAPYGGRASVTVTVEVPPDAVSGTVETTLLTATGSIFGRDVAEDVTVVGCVPVSGVDFAFTPAAPFVGEEVTFTGWATGTPPLTFSWDFGDGSPPVEGNPVTHTFPFTPAVQTYSVTVTVANPCTVGTAATKRVIVQPRTVYLPLVLRLR
ncbi:MAG: PKD domain-containing protein, partial [Anaerolineae bacterium]|nr:PKD domain-containing protein [Anaerolineae bacterium]